MNSKPTSIPLDVKIVGWIGYISATVAFFFVLLLISGFAHIPSGYHRKILFGIFSLESDISLTIHTFLIGTVNLIASYGILKMLKFGWWITLIFSLNNIGDSLLIFNDFQRTATVGICLSLGLIAWLIWRRRLYKIGIKTEKLI